jgi:hypothetical protein
LVCRRRRHPAKHQSGHACAPASPPWPLQPSPTKSTTPAVARSPSQRVVAVVAGRLQARLTSEAYEASLAAITPTTAAAIAGFANLRGGPGRRSAAKYAQSRALVERAITALAESAVKAERWARREAASFRHRAAALLDDAASEVGAALCAQAGLARLRGPDWIGGVGGELCLRLSVPFLRVGLLARDLRPQRAHPSARPLRAPLAPPAAPLSPRACPCSAWWRCPRLPRRPLPAWPRRWQGTLAGAAPPPASCVPSECAVGPAPLLSAGRRLGNFAVPVA